MWREVLRVPDYQALSDLDKDPFLSPFCSGARLANISCRISSNLMRLRSTYDEHDYLPDAITTKTKEYRLQTLFASQQYCQAQPLQVQQTRPRAFGLGCPACQGISHRGVQIRRCHLLDQVRRVGRQAVPHETLEWDG
ncbi:hypothetical protein VTK73DRAFT_4954 [Phialemonium thermophilum]|uniref:Uncharacterized protein n=1 Tax=Phialemonium thermophilum TaxID=223376 RepID=A0ABR3WQY3_9PEZI